MGIFRILATLTNGFLLVISLKCLTREGIKIVCLERQDIIREWNIRAREVFEHLYILRKTFSR